MEDNLKEIRIKENKNYVYTNELKNTDLILVYKNNEIIGMVVLEENYGFVIKSAADSMKGYFCSTIENCIEEGIKKGYTFKTK